MAGALTLKRAAISPAGSSLRASISTIWRRVGSASAAKGSTPLLLRGHLNKSMLNLPSGTDDRFLSSVTRARGLIQARQTTKRRWSVPQPPGIARCFSTERSTRVIWTSRLDDCARGHFHFWTHREAQNGRPGG